MMSKGSVVGAISVLTTALVVFLIFYKPKHSGYLYLNEPTTDLLEEYEALPTPKTGHQACHDIKCKCEFGGFGVLNEWIGFEPSRLHAGPPVVSVLGGLLSVEGIPIGFIGLILSEDRPYIPELGRLLRKIKTNFSSLHPKAVWTGAVIVQTEPTTPYSLLRKIFWTCTEEGFTSVDLAAWPTSRMMCDRFYPEASEETDELICNCHIDASYRRVPLGDRSTRSEILRKGSGNTIVSNDEEKQGERIEDTYCSPERIISVTITEQGFMLLLRVDGVVRFQIIIAMASSGYDYDELGRKVRKLGADWATLRLNEILVEDGIDTQTIITVGQILLIDSIFDSNLKVLPVQR